MSGSEGIRSSVRECMLVTMWWSAPAAWWQGIFRTGQWRRGIRAVFWRRLRMRIRKNCSGMRRSTRKPGRILWEGFPKACLCERNRVYAEHRRPYIWSGVQVQAFFGRQAVSEHIWTGWKIQNWIFYSVQKCFTIGWS